MKRIEGETAEDIDNVEAWVEIVEDMLWLAPADRRADILELAFAKEKASRNERAKHDGFIVYSFNDLDMNTPGVRHWNAIMRLKSLVVQVFIRNITNEHSPEDAAAILFADHRYGTGSGRLSEYLDNLSFSKL